MPPFTLWDRFRRADKTLYDWKEDGFESEDEWALSSFGGLGFADSDQQKKGRRLFAHEILDVTRDVMDFKLNPQSNVDDEQLSYDIYVKEWEPEYMILKCNFTNPDLVSSGFRFDEATLKINSLFLFVSAASGKML